MFFDVIVVGSGFAGSTAARLFAENGKKVLLVEKQKILGGNCHDYKNEHGITIHTHGPHIFHTNDKKAWNFINRFTKFKYYQHTVLSYVDGNFIPFPINKNTINNIFGTNISVNEVESFLKNEVSNSKYNFPVLNFKDAVISQVGEKLYESFFKNYTLKQWGRDPETLSAEIAKRIPVRYNSDNRYFSDIYQGIPLNGYTKTIENMLDHENISILLGTDYFDIKDELTSDILVYTGELDKFFDYKHGKLEYRSLDFRYETIDQEYYQPVSVVNYPNDYDWTRITEYKYFLDEKSHKTTICFEYPKSDGTPYYVVLTEENMRKRDAYLKEIEDLKEKRKILFIGRLAEYKYYNIDQVISSTIDKVNNSNF